MIVKGTKEDGFYDFINGIWLKEVSDEEYYWQCKYCGENDSPLCYKCVGQDGKLVTDELMD